MSNVHHTTRRQLFAVGMSLTAVMALPAIAFPASDLERHRGFLRFLADGAGERALDHAIAAGMRSENIVCMVFTCPDAPALIFNAGSQTRTFKPFGEVR